MVPVWLAHVEMCIRDSTNTRTDEYGGDLPGRSRLMREIVDAVRSVWPATKPLGLRLSATDWTERGLDLETAAAVMHERCV